MGRQSAAAVALLLAAASVAGCGMSTGGGNTSGTTVMQPMAPAAPPAAGAQQVRSGAPAEPAARVAIFLRAVGADFQTASLSPGAVSLVPTRGELTALEAEPAAEMKPGAFALIAQGNASAGEYDGILLQPTKEAKHHSITLAAGKAATPMRLPDRVDLKFDPAKLTPGDHLLLVITLDLADLAAREELQISARRFRAGPLPEDQAAGLKGQVAPSASLARVCACWAKTGVLIAMTQADAFTGEYAFTGLPPGDYYLRVTAAGQQTFQGADKPIALAAGKTTEAPPVVLLPAQGFSGR